MKEATPKIVIRRARESDSMSVWSIRNHPAVRRFSGNPEKIVFSSHRKWFAKKYFQPGENFCAVLEIGGSVRGYVRLDRAAERPGFVISIAVDPNFHGQGLGKKLLTGALKLFKAEATVWADISQTNPKSLRFFQKAGFKVIGQDGLWAHLAKIARAKPKTKGD